MFAHKHSLLQKKFLQHFEPFLTAGYLPMFVSIYHKTEPQDTHDALRRIINRSNVKRCNHSKTALILASR